MGDKTITTAVRRSRSRVHGRLQAKKSDASKSAFLAAFRECGIVQQAANCAKVTRQAHYKWLRTDPAYVEEFDQAHEASVEAMETEARRRAVDGWQEDVYQGGVKVGTKQKYSDVLLIFMMKAANPDRYRDYVSHDHRHAHLHAGTAEGTSLETVQRRIGAMLESQPAIPTST